MRAARSRGSNERPSWTSTLAARRGERSGDGDTRSSSASSPGSQPSTPGVGRERTRLREHGRPGAVRGGRLRRAASPDPAGEVGDDGAEVRTNEASRPRAGPAPSRASASAMTTVGGWCLTVISTRVAVLRAPASSATSGRADRPSSDDLACPRTGLRGGDGRRRRSVGSPTQLDCAVNPSDRHQLEHPHVSAKALLSRARRGLPPRASVPILCFEPLCWSPRGASPLLFRSSPASASSPHFHLLYLQPPRHVPHFFAYPGVPPSLHFFSHQRLPFLFSIPSFLRSLFNSSLSCLFVLPSSPSPFLFYLPRQEVLPVVSRPPHYRRHPFLARPSPLPAR